MPRRVIVLLAAAALTACSSSGGPAGSTADPSSTVRAPSAARTSVSSGAGPSLVPSTSIASVSSSNAAEPAVRAARKIKAATDYLGSGGVSVEAVRLDDGSTFRYGARRGMACGSVAKLFILETLLLQRQDDGDELSENERDLTRRMIVNSDNAASDSLYGTIGAGDALNAAAERLGVEHFVPGPGLYWGFSRTSARDFVALLRNLATPGVLSAPNRKYALELMEDVEADQRWGVSAAADDDTTVRLKNGWLPSDMDSGRWLVNSVGIVTVNGHRVLLAVMTQHGSSFSGGVALVERIARIAAGVVSPG